MRDAMGGTWLTGLVIIFIFLFAGFLAYSISYTKAFRAKNEILNLIERNEGFTTSANNLDNITDDALKNDPSVEGKAFNYIKSLGYNYTIFDGTNDPCTRNNLGEKQKGGYCLIKYCPKSGESEKVYYKVTTFIALSIPIINVTIKLPISGETKALYYDVSTFNCSK